MIDKDFPEPEDYVPERETAPAGEDYVPEVSLDDPAREADPADVADQLTELPAAEEDLVGENDEEDGL